MSIDDPTCRLMRWSPRISPLDISIIHRVGRVNQVPDAVSRLRRDREPAFISGDEEIPNFEDATVLAVCMRSGTLGNDERTRPDSIDPEDANGNAYDDQSDDEDDLLGKDNIEIDAIDLYQAADLEADIDPDHRDALADAERDQVEAVPTDD